MCIRDRYRTVRSILSMSENISHPYLDGGAGSKKGVIVITSNRGLAGGYNSNITKLITKGDFSKEDVYKRQFQQSGLSPGRGPVDFIRQQDIGEHRPFLPFKLFRFPAVNMHTRDIRRQHIRRELDSAEIHAQ